MTQRKITYLPPKPASRGFTLMEFLVAGALGMIVLVAATSGYTAMRNMNQAANARAAVQQDVRRAAALLAQDARQAGAFGCFDTAKAVRGDVLEDSAPDHAQALTAAGQAGVQPVKVLGSAAALGISGFSSSGSVLVFQYGTPSGTLYAPGQDVAAGAALYSSCRYLFRPSENLPNAAAIRAALRLADTRADGEVSVMRYTPAAYAVGSLNGEQGLYRFGLDDNGRWGSPQLLVANAASWSLAYLYVENCPAGSNPSETFVYTATANPARTPALIRISLNGGNIASEAGGIGIVDVPAIEVGIKGGNACANRVW
ncbi:PilW family protein [Bergeriella denitrificans]|uniref:Prepilin-type N-terminal cleavage/methylation domain-containing protein n=1 Tax=Bergeriella denitrificans TaxID=494 RepID=A0A378UJ90_BERDE|nr:prepilin-type N-terminal cleavage/methylation domain-containing protein [Bergeriella denitrificans]STZ76739.1 prepilin-type N-terminal cleavage/methylation domain-containing protein [Bergeriella denitrificans]